MIIKTKFFGEVELDDDKVLEFSNGIIGFEHLKLYAILYDEDKEEATRISWLQSLEEPLLVLPIVDPSSVIADYSPIIEDELLTSLENNKDEDLLILVALSVPGEDMTKVTANLKAPFIINAETKKGAQIIVENPDYPVKFNVYESIQAMKAKLNEKAGE